MTSTRFQTTDLVYIAFFSIIIATCSWLSIPTTIPFTLQTFAVFLSVLLLGGKKATMTVIVYLLLGSIGAPVFAGFTGGIGVLLGSTGGYLIGFLVIPLLYWLVIKHPGSNYILEIATLIVGLFICYGFGTLWFIIVYTSSTEAIGIMTALWWCVIPYIIPDLIKLSLAYVIANRVRPYVNQ